MRRGGRLPALTNGTIPGPVTTSSQNALQRLEARGWIRAECGTSDNNCKARFYELTKAGRKQLAAETQQWRRLAFAIGRILGPEEA
jgi:DNA-binding PadR family transcriptional regulator